MSPQRPSARWRLTVSEWTTTILRRCYKGQRPEDVVDQVMRLKATADGHLDAGGRIKQGRRR